MATRVLLLRHAETSAPDRFHGAESDVGLGEHGFDQAREVAGRLSELRPDAVFCSGLRRAIETASIIAESCGLESQVVEALHERRMGVLSGMLKDADGMALYESEKARWMAGDLDHAEPGSESFANVRDRVVPVFRDLVARRAGETIVVVAHGIINRVLLTTLLDGFGPADFDRIGIGFVAINDLTWDGRSWLCELKD